MSEPSIADLQKSLADIQKAQAASGRAQEHKEAELRQTLEATKKTLEDLRSETLTLRSKVATGQLQQQQPVGHVADGYEALLRTQLSILLTEANPDDAWPTIVEKWLKKHKPKNSKGDTILVLDPLRVANPDVMYVVVAWVAMIDADLTGNTVELLMSKITARFPFSDELIEEVGLLLLAVQRTCQVTAVGKKASEKMMAVTEVITVLQRRVEWLEKRLSQKSEKKDTPGTPPAKRIALRGNHF